MTEALAPPVISLTDVTKEFKSRGKPPISALRGVNLSISRGSMVAIKGPSGSGKTTLMHIIGALDVPTSGGVLVEGEELTEKSELDLTYYRAQTIGFIFQNYNLIPNLTVRENVCLPMEILGVAPPERRKRAMALLEEVKMEERADAKPTKLSGGEAQRVAIARALANEPSILLADEPTGNLDSVAGDSVLRLLMRLNKEKGATVIIVTHSGRIPPLCDTTFTMRDGKVTSEQASKEMAAKEAERRRLLATLAVSSKIVDWLMDAGFTSVEKIAQAPLEKLVEIVRDRKRATRLAERAKLLVENRDVIE